MHFVEWKLLCVDLIFTSLYSPTGPINDMSAMVQVMAWHKRQAITWTNGDLDHRHIIMSTGLNGLHNGNCITVTS